MNEPNLEVISLVHGNLCGINNGACMADCACRCHQLSVEQGVERARLAERRPLMSGHPAGCRCERCDDFRRRAYLAGRV